MKTWKIASTIQDGEHEYGDDFTRELATDHLDEKAVAELIADQWDIADPAEREDFLKELRGEGHAFLPGDSRAITNLGWERISPIVVTVRDGLVVGVTGLPVDITVEVRDWDNGELDAAGEPIPTVSEWTGPL